MSMCKKTTKLTLLFAVLTGGWQWAAMEVSSLLEVVPSRGNHLLGGYLGFTISGDDFATASPESPVYVRIMLDDNVRFSDSLVDPLDPILASPVYIPLMVVQPDGPKLIAPADTFSVLSWKESSEVPTAFSIELKVIQDMLAEMEDLVVRWSFDLTHATRPMCSATTESIPWHRAVGIWHNRRHQSEPK